jgi:hypothetical protein
MLSNAKNEAAVQVRISGHELAELEKWRRAQRIIPPRSDVLREALRRFIAKPLNDSTAA